MASLRHGLGAAAPGSACSASVQHLAGPCSTSGRAHSSTWQRQADFRSCRWPQRRAVVVVQAAGGTSGSGRDGLSSGGGSGGSGGGGMHIGGRRARPEHRKGKAKQPGLFEIKVTTPPPRSLGIYSLPPLTHNGEEIEIDGQGYIVTSLNIHFKLEKGKYVRTHHRLDVQPTGRFLVNLALESAMARATFVKPWDTGLQD